MHQSQTAKDFFSAKDKGTNKSFSGLRNQATLKAAQPAQYFSNEPTHELID
jgi:hypothetical protein